MPRRALTRKASEELATPPRPAKKLRSDATVAENRTPPKLRDNATLSEKQTPPKTAAAASRSSKSVAEASKEQRADDKASAKPRVSASERMQAVLQRMNERRMSEEHGLRKAIADKQDMARKCDNALVMHMLLSDCFAQSSSGAVIVQDVIKLGASHRNLVQQLSSSDSAAAFDFLAAKACGWFRIDAVDYSPIKKAVREGSPAECKSRLQADRQSALQELEELQVQLRAEVAAVAAAKQG
mmetsp:Transcript_20098/g.46839  ORF Transcript_20098/g.46839 Transcript_20098/m.46839 type:complete len:241 (-) Transcript_20098:100-822(-)|eukprot:CAMPEP_0178445384 /NCGR_PEP_ID=MMETSP0689_2-20121128/40121_1 /TAXON_ID=160604 /ORGANISM="Amphidinium massartii, Strain CS-259" /LENGTH=240 /DNA_ID=CAMNT_0020069897 /DNA_START=58 /DNA_END=780 /DNA_ORIENTATION=+